MRINLIVPTIALATILATILATGGCSRSEDGAGTALPPASAPPASVSPVVAPGRPTVYAAALTTPEAFVRALYGTYVTPPPPKADGSAPDTPAPGQDPLYSRMLNATIGADVRVAKGEVPTLDYDPVCACQDGGDFTLDSVAVTQADSHTADAAVVFTNQGQTTHQTLKLVREGPAWKIDDFVDADGKSLSAALLKVVTAAGG